MIVKISVSIFQIFIPVAFATFSQYTEVETSEEKFERKMSRLSQPLDPGIDFKVKVNDYIYKIPS